MWGNYRMRHGDDIVAEMKKHGALLGRKSFKCNDLMVNGDLKAMEVLTRRLVEEKLGYEWGSMARAREDMTPQMFFKLREAGCRYLTFGVESGAAKVLSNMGKPGKQALARTFKLAHDAGIKVNTLWMVGYPQESWLDIFETMFFLFQQRRYIDEFVSVSACYIPSRSLLGKHQQSLGIKYNEKSEWYIGRSNTPFVREVRRKMLLWLAKKLGLYKAGI